MMKNKAMIAAALGCSVFTGSAFAVIQYDQNLTNAVIFGDGNAGGSFTTDRANGVELGLRGKLRHNANGAPENTFNSNGDGSYTFQAGIAPTQSSSTAVWSFEWSINSNYDNSTFNNLDDLTYSLSMTSTVGTSILTFDPINGANLGNSGVVQWDHALGNNSTGNGEGVSVPNDGSSPDLIDNGYGDLISVTNLAQNSWKPHWFVAGFDPEAVGVYTFTLAAFDGSTQLASTSIDIHAVPEPTSLALLSLGSWTMLRRRRN